MLAADQAHQHCVDFRLVQQKSGYILGPSQRPQPTYSGHSVSSNVTTQPLGGGRKSTPSPPQDT